MKVKVKSLSRFQLFMTPWSAAYQAPPSMGFSRQEYWSGVPLPSPELGANDCLLPGNCQVSESAESLRIVGAMREVPVSRQHSHIHVLRIQRAVPMSPGQKLLVGMTSASHPHPSGMPAGHKNLGSNRVPGGPLVES